MTILFVSSFEICSTAQLSHPILRSITSTSPSYFYAHPAYAYRSTILSLFVSTSNVYYTRRLDTHRPVEYVVRHSRVCTSRRILRPRNVICLCLCPPVLKEPSHRFVVNDAALSIFCVLQRIWPYYAGVVGLPHPVCEREGVRVNAPNPIEIAFDDVVPP